MSSTWQPPRNYQDRPVAVLGAGVLGRRIGCIWASAGYDVRIRDPSPEQRDGGISYIRENVASYAKNTGKVPGDAQAFEDLGDAVANAWLVIEAVPERIHLKIDTFAQLEALAPRDCILASNSSSYQSSEMLEKVSDTTKARILNMHYYMPPQCMVVELMTDGHTQEEIFPFMTEQCQAAATMPYVARKQSTGLIFNRLWAAVKREVLIILAEGVSVPQEIDSMWTEMFIKGGMAPCKTMDQVGLDTVAFIESHYVKERGLSPKYTVDFLNDHYVNNGRLGNKSAHGGLYPPTEPERSDTRPKPNLLVLDIGLSGPNPTMTSGSILECSTDGKIQRTLVQSQVLPDGLAVDRESRRLFWTNMGIPGQKDGTVFSANLDGTDIRAVVPPGSVNTPKQLALDSEAKKVYFSDREGLRVYRCNFDGSGLEAIISAGDVEDSQQAQDASNWCVGIAVVPRLDRFYWTQKGPSKGGRGRIFCANISTPVGASASSRTDVQCILKDLPEPIDLEVDETSRILYWTDRGEIPFGNSLNRVQLDEAGLPLKTASEKHGILARNLNEAIGLKLDPQNNCIYLTDLGGSIYRCDLNGMHKVTIYSDEDRAFTGVTLL